MGIKLPKIQIGRFLRKTVAPLIPGGSTVAESVNSVIKAVKGKTSAGQNVVPATQAAIVQVNEDAQRKQLITWGLIAAGVVLLILVVRK